MRLTAADRMPETGDVLALGTVVSIEQDGIYIDTPHIQVDGTCGVIKLVPTFWLWREVAGFEYVSRADGGPVTKEDINAEG